MVGKDEREVGEEGTVGVKVRLGEKKRAAQWHLPTSCSLFIEGFI